MQQGQRAQNGTGCLVKMEPALCFVTRRLVVFNLELQKKVQENKMFC